MAKIVYRYGDGTRRVVERDTPASVMRAAVEAGVPGIVGECGGQTMCATCHVYVDDGYVDRLPAVGDDEEEMLECTAAPRDAARSRLSCQIVVGAGLDEIEVDVPDTQI
ncbi:2Fe-2S iron-sulfur cluster-binding protein [Streptosporangium sp. NPDC051022]|uniref:2Fe-2S iron-sulfur cluster-binding protein n=1 Tax=Streptosporangium sp. NPDC051022 TaxID=3155752 RepID=UPI003445266A